MKPLAAGSGAFAFAATVWLACAATNIQPFIAGQYDPKLDCVSPGYAIDVINSAGTDAACDAICVVTPYDSGGVFISGQCAPFPPGDLINPTSAPLGELCAKGIAAIHRSDLCLEAGPSNPLVDSGTADGAAPD